MTIACGHGQVLDIDSHSFLLKLNEATPRTGPPKGKSEFSVLTPGCVILYIAYIVFYFLLNFLL